MNKQEGNSPAMSEMDDAMNKTSAMNALY
jgi:hypothetical protein